MKEAKRNTPSTAEGQSLAILGHELDNVLNGLLGMTRLLRDSGLNAEQDRWSRAIEHSGRQLRRLVSAFRASEEPPGEAQREAAARPGEVPLRYVAGGEVESLDGIDLLEQAVISQAPLAARRRNRILLTIDPGIPQEWQADACRLRQLLDNLLGNANKFTVDGEILLCASLDRSGEQAAGRTLRLTVTDSGPGVDPEAKSRVFEVWEQESDRTRLEFGGSGLGLYVCREAVSAMGGTIGLCTPPGGGARFEISLPGVVWDRGPSPLPASRILSRLQCLLDLSDPVRTSVDAWLNRLGVRCGPGDGSRQRCGSGELLLRVSELPDCGVHPGPTLLLAPLDGRPAAECARRLSGPIVGSTLGPLLLELALDWLWLRNDRPDSVPRRRR
jgi:hypothetical protein